MNYYGVIKTLFLTNKKQNLNKNEDKIYLLVDISVNKNTLKQAFEKIFGIHVIKINTIIMRGKIKSKRRFKKSSNFKKAIFTIKKNSNKDILKT